MIAALAFVVAGTYALAGHAPAASATMTVTPRGPLAAHLEIVERANGAPLRAFAIDMTKRMHLIVVKDDFSNFQHLHPAYDGDGRFSADVRVPTAGRYDVYADADPQGFGKVVFRFTLPFGSAPDRAPVLSPADRTARAGPYVVTLARDRLPAGTETHLAIAVARDGVPARDLRPYLGGAAHAVLIDARTLDYVHAHPVPAGSDDAPGMAMPGMPEMAEATPMPADARVAPEMVLHLGPLAAGRYELWLQFRGGGSLRVARFSLSVG